MIYTVDMVYTLDMVYTADMVHTADMVYTVMREMRGMRGEGDHNGKDQAEG